MKVHQAYRFALDPTPAQEQRLRSHAGAARYAWNWGLDQCRKRYEAERKWYSGVDLHRLWNEEKQRNPELAWWRENSKCAGGLPQPGPGSARLPRRQERPAEGAPSRVPQAQAEGAVPGFLPLQHRGDALLGDHGHPPQVGSPIRTHESTEALARKMAEGKARILSATVSRAAQRWFVSFTVEVERKVPERHRRLGTAVGMDMGVTHLRGTPRSQLGGDPLRLDALHKATTMLASRYETVVVEDLNVTGMLRNRRLARSLTDQAFGTVRQQLGYQTAWRGGRLIVADRFLPSSKTCSACGTVKAKLSLAERVYRCEGCGLVIDRDVNAARNLLMLAGSEPESQNACGAEVRPSPAGRTAKKDR